MELPTVICVDSDDREEGEIIDDDFEDISDNSIIVPCTLNSGKSVSSKEHLNALSLSSVSEVEEQDKEKQARVHRRRKSLGHNKRLKHGRKRRRRASTHKTNNSDSDSEHDTVDKEMQMKLKDAVRLEDSNVSSKNTLQMRLRGMTTKNNGLPELQDEDNIIEMDDEGIKQSEADNELTQLRLEALRTAVLNKLLQRKRKKEILSNSSKESNDTNNKENAIEDNNTNSSFEKDRNTPDVTNGGQEEDEDVLRAILLASISKKITVKDSREIKTTPLPVISNNNNNNLVKKIVPPIKPPVLKVQTNKNVIIRHQNIVLPKVKPLIINVNPNSESEDESDAFQSSSPEKERTNFSNTVLQNSVEKFLKEERAKMEAKLALQVKTPPSNNNKTTHSPVSEKSAVKLLPKSKQIEYRKLVETLKNAEKKPRVRRTSVRLLNSEARPLKVARLEKNQEQPKTESVVSRTLRDIQARINGRLQIQEPYKHLAPVVKKLSVANQERKKHNLHVKKLIEELAEAKKLLFKSQQEFTACVKEFLSKKLETDEKITDCNKNKANNNAIEEKEEVETEQIFMGDPNDIDKIVKQNIHPVEEFPKYVSPLDKTKRVTDDPLAIICPFDVSGMCRDPDCSYKHIVNK